MKMRKSNIARLQCQVETKTRGKWAGTRWLLFILNKKSDFSPMREDQPKMNIPLTV